jgi:hypothetical protein
MPQHVRKNLWIVDGTLTQTRGIVELNDVRHFQIVPVAIVNIVHL